MSEQLDIKTFDLVAAIEGRSYPTLEVKAHLNETLGFEMYQVEKKRQQAQFASKEDMDAFDAEFDKFVKAAEEGTYTVHLKAVPERVKRDILKKVLAEYPTKKGVFGAEEPPVEADDMYTKLNWEAHITHVVDPSGAVATVDAETVTALFDKAPATFHEKVNLGIAELQTGSKAGYEAMAKDLDFLSHASTEG